MGNEVAVVERMLQPYAPRFEDLLRGSIITPKSFMQQIYITVERTPKVAECTPQSIVNSVNTAAVLRLPIDGATGQFFILPFKDTAQGCIGYRGFNTIAARSHVTIAADVVREGDHEWDYRKGTGGFIRHKPKLDNQGKIIAVWATAQANDGRPDVIEILGIGEINEVMSRSPAVKFKKQTPWSDPRIGFIAMAQKTGKRRLSRSIPFEIDNGNFLRAARLDEAFDEQGKFSYIGDRGEVVVSDIAGERSEESHTPTVATLTAPRVEADPVLEAAKEDLRGAAEHGTARLAAVWSVLPREVRVALQAFKDEQKRRAERVDMGTSPDDESH